MVKFFFVFFLALLAISQYQLFRAAKELTFEQTILEFNYSTRKQLYYALAILVGFLFIVFYPSLISWLILFLIVIFFGAYVQIANYRFLKSKNHPKRYLNYLVVCSFLTYLSEIGLLVCFFLLT